MRKHHSKVLIDLIVKHSFINIVEIGLGNGLTAKTILSALVPSYPFVYYGIDPYKEYEEYTGDINSTPHRLIKNKNLAENNLSSFRKGRFVHFKMKSPVASFKFMKNTIDLVFIDGNHSYEYVKSDLEKYYPKVRTNGIIAIHDYDHPYHTSFPGVKKAVDEFVFLNNLELKKDGDVVYFYRSPQK